MKTRHKRIAIVVGGLAALGVATALVLNALESNLVFFYSPSQIEAKETPVARSFRLGGMVKEGSVQRDGVHVNFIVTDTVKTTPVRYAGILPDLFKEGKGVVAQGKLENGVFVAKEVLAKHDENYMPPEAAEAITKAKGQGGAQPANTLAVPASAKPSAYGGYADKAAGNAGDPR